MQRRQRRRARRRLIMISDKVRPHHLQRKAILYVRQSSAHQVLHNRESSALQYAMRDRLMALGWSEIEVIDDDLGRSAAGGVQRAGFERMVAEVCLGKVGAVCAREVSRFARNSRDWQQLIEMCRVVDTVLIDQETIYAPRHGNDRLLLGLKGSLNEYELDLLRQRSLSARYEKARRGELVVGAPVGFVYRAGAHRSSPDRISTVSTTRHISISCCQSRLLRAKRETSRAHTAPTLPRHTSATIRSKPARWTPPAAERPRSSSMTSISDQPSAARRSRMAYCSTLLSRLCRT